MTRQVNVVAPAGRFGRGSAMSSHTLTYCEAYEAGADAHVCKSDPPETIHRTN